MLKLICTIFLFSTFTLNVWADGDADEMASKEEITLNKVKHTEEDRILFSEIEVWFDQSSLNLILEGEELKDADIYILTESGIIVHHSTHYFGMIPDTYNIDAPSFPGKYYIVIDSPVLYAEGMFEIRK